MYWEMSSDEDSDSHWHLLKLNPYKLQKVKQKFKKIIYFFSTLIVTLISGEFYIIATLLDINPGH